MSYVLDDVNVMLSLGVAISLYLIGLAYISTRKFAGRSFLIRIYSFAFVVRLLALFSIYFALLSLGGYRPSHASSNCAPIQPSAVNLPLSGAGSLARPIPRRLQ